MKFFLDTANLSELKQAVDWGLCDGVTTNPSLIAKEGVDFKQRIKEITEIVHGPISAEVLAVTHKEILAEAHELVKIHKNIVVKVPFIPEGVKAIKDLAKEGIKVNCTLIFSASQALVAAKAGAEYVSPFIGRLDDISEDGMLLIKEIKEIFKNYDYIKTKILVASVRHPRHVVDAAKIGAEYCTMPFDVLKKLFNHPLTDIGLKKFLEDAQKAGLKV
ncbi:MAG: fructose-6-phosphate aldolase, partial [Candidatus Diapherotrites archaeon]|nr:fructose-6-phosphate aldolase [Candidatus Diapherotrites archaeon]